MSFERSHDAKVDDEWRAVQLRLVPLLSGDPMAGLNLLEAFVRERPLPLDIRWDVLRWRHILLFGAGEHERAFAIHEKMTRWTSPPLYRRVCQCSIYAADLLEVGRVGRARAVLEQGLALAATDSNPAVDGQLLWLLELLCQCGPTGRPRRVHVDAVRRLAALWRFPIPTRLPRTWKAMCELVGLVRAHARAHGMMIPYEEGDEGEDAQGNAGGEADASRDGCFGP